MTTYMALVTLGNAYNHWADALSVAEACEFLSNDGKTVSPNTIIEAVSSVHEEIVTDEFINAVYAIPDGLDVFTDRHACWCRYRIDNKRNTWSWAYRVPVAPAN